VQLDWIDRGLRLSVELSVELCVGGWVVQRLGGIVEHIALE
jgi:hypothetical protein